MKNLFTGGNIIIYPTARRSVNIDESMLNLPDNIILKNNVITDINSYVIDGFEQDGNTVTPGRAIIAGYYIEWNESINLSSSKYLYLTLDIDTHEVVKHQTASLPQNSDYVLLGTVDIISGEPVLDKTLVKTKLDFDKTIITPLASWNLSKNTNTETLKNFFEEDLVIDDGDLTSYTSQDSKLIISYRDKTNISIDLASVYNNSNLTLTRAMIPNISDITAIHIPKYVKNIENGILSGCSYIKELEIPFIGQSRELSSTLSYICNPIPASLKKVSITDSSLIAYQAFKSCSNIEKINLKCNITQIGAEAFQGCSKLARIKLPSTITNIGNNAFSGCSLLSYINLPKSLISIGSYALANCSNLSELDLESALLSDFDSSNTLFNSSCLNGLTVKVKDGCKKLPAYLFYTLKDKNIDVVFTSNSSLESIGDRCFSGCLYLTKINLPSTLLSIGNYAFSESGLKSIYIPDNVSSIGEGCFSNCLNLSYCYLGKNIGLINSYTFYNTQKLNLIDFNCEQAVLYPSEKADTIFAFCGYAKNTLTINFGEDVIDIPDNIFYNNSYVRNVCIHNNVQAIGENCFYNCSSANTIILGTEKNKPFSLTSVGRSFYKLVESQAIGIDYSYDSIKTKTFSAPVIDKYLRISDIRSWFNITSQWYGNSLNAYNMYYNNSLVREITVPDDVEEIKDYAFTGNANLTILRFTEQSQCRTIGSSAFNGCSNLISLVLPPLLSRESFDSLYSYSSTKLVEIYDLPGYISSISTTSNYKLYYYLLNAPKRSLSSASNIYLENGVYYYNSKTSGDSNKYFTALSPLCNIGTIPIKEGCETLYTYFMQESSTYNITKSIILPASFSIDSTKSQNITTVRGNILSRIDSLQSISISDNSTSYITYDGILYSRNMDTLYVIPKNTSLKDYVLPSFTRTIKSYSIQCPLRLLDLNTCNTLEDYGVYNSTIYMLIFRSNITNRYTNSFYNTWVDVLDIPSIDTWFNIIGASGDKCNPLKNSKYGVRRLLINHSEILQLDLNKAIPPYAFYYCSNIPVITLRSGVTSIGSSAFQGCYPKEVNNFAGMSSDTIYNYFWNYPHIRTSNSDTSYITLINNNSGYSYALYKSNYDTYNTIVGIAGNSTDFSITSNLEEALDIKGIGEYAFQKTPFLTSITLPHTLLKIASKSFYSCLNLSTIINNSRFYIDKNMSNPDSAGYISKHAQNITNTYQTTINGGIYYIKDTDKILVRHISDNYSFSIDSGTNGLVSDCFYDSANLQQLTIPSTVIQTDDEWDSTVLSSLKTLFDRCYKLSEIFNYCPNLTIRKGTAPSSSLPGSSAIYCSTLLYLHKEEEPSRLSEINNVIYYTNTLNKKYIIGMKTSNSLLTTFDSTTFGIRQSSFYGYNHLTSIPIEQITSLEYLGSPGSGLNINSIIIPASVKVIAGLPLGMGSIVYTDTYNKPVRKMISIKFLNPNNWWKSSVNATSGTDIPASSLEDSVKAVETLTNIGSLVLKRGPNDGTYDPQLYEIEPYDSTVSNATDTEPFSWGRD